MNFHFTTPFCKFYDECAEKRNTSPGVKIMLKKVSLVVAALFVMAAPLSGCGRNKAPETASPSLLPQTEEPTGEGETSIGRGSWDGDVFTSEFAHLSFTLPEGWTAVSEEELAGMMGIAEDFLKEENKWILEAAKLQTIYDMIARDELTGNNVIIQYENLAKNPDAASMSETEYLEVLKKQLESLEEMDYSFGEPYSASFSGSEYSGIRANEAGLGLEQYFFIRKQNGYMVTIIVSLSDETTVDDVTAYFKYYTIIPF